MVGNSSTCCVSSATNACTASSILRTAGQGGGRRPSGPHSCQATCVTGGTRPRPARVQGSWTGRGCRCTDGGDQRGGLTMNPLRSLQCLLDGPIDAVIIPFCSGWCDNHFRRPCRGFAHRWRGISANEGAAARGQRGQRRRRGSLICTAVSAAARRGVPGQGGHRPVASGCRASLLLGQQAPRRGPACGARRGGAGGSLARAQGSMQLPHASCGVPRLPTSHVGRSSDSAGGGVHAAGRLASDADRVSFSSSTNAAASCG